MSLQLSVKIKRYAPESSEPPKWESFEVEADPLDRVLDVIQKIKWDQDETLGFRRSCAMEFAGPTPCASTA